LVLANTLTGKGKVAVAQCDVLDATAVDDAIAGIHRDLGGIDVLINNAGVSRQVPALKQTPDDFDAVINTNLRGAWLVAVATANLMVADGTKGSIVNIGSILGERVANNVAAYAISKAAVLQMTKALALEWARHNIRVNALAPGYLSTDMNAEFFATDAGKALIKRIPQRRLGELSELDGPILLLAFDAGSFITGTEIVADGGHLISSL
jgi:NAD(P)-dependent dehydrogenase (short-subunit alcohol dehydrogenase family)